MRAVPVSEGITWVGAVDWSLRDFHGYETPRGTTYNAYVVRGSDKTALVDTVKLAFVPELLSRLAEVVPPAAVDLIVVNHVEPDHNSGLREVMDACPNARVVASRAGVTGVAEHHDGLGVEAVGPGEVVDLGGRTLRFMPVPMVHWPDSMFTYCPEVRTLMPNDAFGQHVASAERFADEVGLDLALAELGVYYANILMPLGKQVASAVEKVGEAGWELDVVAPSHGVIWRGEAVGRAAEAYGRWTAGTLRGKVVVAFSTMWGSTDVMARAVADGAAEAGAEVTLHDLAASRIADVTYELLEAPVLALGSPTLHHGMLYRVAGYLRYLAGLEPPGRAAGVFGSYGWGGGACKEMKGRLEEIGFDMPFEALTLKYRPTAEDVRRCREWGRELGREAKARAGA
ncbi:MAG: FprA family A-type flavoprotein [Coriobacteriia bacterium]|nr:FprA family A-type flavoprotein [Coriobacteriia bacterium]